MAAASVNLSCFLATRPITSTRSSSRVLIAVLFNKTSLAGGLSLRGHFYSVREGTLSKSFNITYFHVTCGQRMSVTASRAVGSGFEPLTHVVKNRANPLH